MWVNSTSARTVSEKVIETAENLSGLLKVLCSIMEKHTDTIMPGFTHLQKAQPVTLAHHMGAYFEMFKRDAGRLLDIYERMNECPLGAGALAGTTYPLDRDMTSNLLGFDAPTANSMDSVSDRDYLLEFLSALSIIMVHLSRLSEELIIWNSNEYRFVEMDDRYSTGSSIMPQKKNPDIAELIRGKTGRVYGALTGLLTVMKGIPLAYDKDLQEDKELSFDAMDTVNDCLELCAVMLDTASFNKENMLRSAALGFTDATDVADYLVRKGVPFRDAHSITGKLVLFCVETNCAIGDLSVSQMKEIDSHFEDDIYEAIDMQNIVDRRVTKGAPGKKAMESELAQSRIYIEELDERLKHIKDR